MTRVLLVGDAASVHLRRLATSLAAAGCAVRIAGFEGALLDGIPIHRLGRLPLGADRRYLLAIPRLAALLRRHRPDVINAHYLTSYGLMGALALRLAFPVGPRPPLVQTVWGDDLLVTPRRSELHRRLAAVALRSAAMVTGDSADLADATRSLAPAVPWTTVVFGPPRALLDAPLAKEHLIISARQLVPDMRVGLIIRAFLAAKARCAGKLDGWRLVVAGSGPEDASLRAIAAKEPDVVEIVGGLAHDGLGALLLRSSVQVSIPVSDATSATLLEGLAAGSLPVVNDLPANREWVDADTGVIVSRDPTVDELAAALRQAVASEPMTSELRSRVAHVTWESQVELMTGLLDRLAGRARRLP
jgi:glycosyltransferase involved in cell wall biosynthesis